MLLFSNYLFFPTPITTPNLNSPTVYVSFPSHIKSVHVFEPTHSHSVFHSARQRRMPFMTDDPLNTLNIESNGRLLPAFLSVTALVRVQICKGNRGVSKTGLCTIWISFNHFFPINDHSIIRRSYSAHDSSSCPCYSNPVRAHQLRINSSEVTKKKGQTKGFDKKKKLNLCENKGNKYNNFSSKYGAH